MTPSKAEQADATRTALLAAARELFTDRGYAATSTTEIVARAGVTRGALYHHFPAKHDLFRAVFDDVEIPGLQIGDRPPGFVGRRNGQADHAHVRGEQRRPFLDRQRPGVQRAFGRGGRPGSLCAG